jgi:hypothetical protein
MIEFCLSSKYWIDMSTSFSRALPNLWLCIIGLPRFTSSLWAEKDKQIIEAMKKYFIQLAPRVLISRDGAYRFVSWLNEPSADPIRLEMLELLYSISKASSDYWWEKKHLTTVIARYLNIIWDHHRKELTSNETLKKQFLEILHEISARHEPIALEIQSRMTSR